MRERYFVSYGWQPIESAGDTGEGKVIKIHREIPTDREAWDKALDLQGRDLTLHVAIGLEGSRKLFARSSEVVWRWRRDHQGDSAR